MCVCVCAGLPNALGGYDETPEIMSGLLKVVHVNIIMYTHPSMHAYTHVCIDIHAYLPTLGLHS